MVTESSTNGTSRKQPIFARLEQVYSMAWPFGSENSKPRPLVCGGNFSHDPNWFSCTLFKACHNRCTFGHFYFSKNVLASWTVLKHAHSSTESSCIIITTVNTGQTHQIITALRVCILYLFAMYRKSQQVKHLLTPTGLKYICVCVCVFVSICARFFK